MQQQLPSLAMFAAIRRGSSFVSSLAADLRPGSFSKIDIDELLSVGVADDKAGGLFLQRTRAAGSGDCSSHLGQCQLFPEMLQMRGHDRPSEGLWPLWRIEPDLESDGDSG